MAFDLETGAFFASLAAAAQALQQAGERAVGATGESTGERAAALAPVETGELRDSMRVSEGRDAQGFFVDIAFEADHAAANEFGTSTRPAKPFLRRALAEAPALLARSAR